MRNDVPNRQKRSGDVGWGWGGWGGEERLHFLSPERVGGHASLSHRSSPAPAAWLHTSLQTAA